MIREEYFCSIIIFNTLKPTLQNTTINTHNIPHIDVKSIFKRPVIKSIALKAKKFFNSKNFKLSRDSAIDCLAMLSLTASHARMREPVDVSNNFN